MTVWIAVGVVLVVLLLLGAWFLFGSRPEAARVVRRDIVAREGMNGEVIAPPGTRVDVTAPFAGPVAQVHTSVGGTVEQGAVLVEMSYPSAQVAYDQSRRAVQAAETAHANAAAEWDAAISAARSRLQAARTAEQQAREPVDVEVSPDNDLSVTITEPAGDAVGAAQERAYAEQEIARLQAQKEAALLPFTQQLETARENFRQAQSGRQLAMLRAPISGTVLALNARPGAEIPDEETPVVTIVNLNALELHAEISREQAALVEEGMPVELIVDEYPNEPYEGEVRAITTEPRTVLGTRYVVLVSVKNRNGEIKPGMKARATVKIDEVKDVLAVPAAAVTTNGNGLPVVRTQRQGEWQEVVVEPGLTDGEYTEIRSGLEEGETV
jgi:multidrug efflux pump subunit AcrA (membrane-fusion protein)